MNKKIIILILLAFPNFAKSSEMVFHFTNPNFGGNPAMTTILMNQATEQNKFKAPPTPTPTKATKTPIETFKENLQRSILNKIAGNTVEGLFDENGNIMLGSELNFDLNNDGESDFSVNVNEIPDSNNINISITDGISNTSLVIPKTSFEP